MDKTDNYFGRRSFNVGGYEVVDSFTVLATVKDKFGNTFTLEDEMHRFGYLLKRNGTIEKKNNQAMVIYKTPKGYAIQADNNGSVYARIGKDVWYYLIKDSKPLTDQLLMWDSQQPIHKTGVKKKGISYTSDELIETINYILQGKKPVYFGKNGDPDKMHFMYIMGKAANRDLSKGFTIDEVNYKWDTLLTPPQKNPIVKVGAGIVTGFVAGGPVGALVGGVGAVAQQAKVDKAYKTAAQTGAKNVGETIEAVKLIQSQSPVTTVENVGNENKLAQGLQLAVKNPFVIAGVILLLVIVFYLQSKKK